MPAKKGTYDPFEQDCFRGYCSGGDDDEEKYEAHLLAVTEGGCCVTRKRTDDAEQDGSEDDQFADLRHDCHGRETGPVRGEARREHQQRQHIGQHCGTDGHNDCGARGEPRRRDHRESDERMRRDQRTHQHRRNQRIAESVRNGYAAEEWKGKGRNAKQSSALSGARKLVEVNVQPDEEHQQQLAELGEEICDISVLWNDAEHMRSDQDAEQDVADAVWQAQAWAEPADRQDTE